jgi:hypothetical protein
MGFLDFLRGLWGELPKKPANAPEGPVPAQPAAPRPAPASKKSTASDLPAIRSMAELATALGVSAKELAWLCDPGRMLSAEKPHYRLLIRRKRNGMMRPVLAPKKKLKAAQRWILRNILDKAPVTAWCHGFVKDRSIRTNASAHVGRAVLLRLDIKDFFHQYTFKPVVGLFRQWGYPIEVARGLGYLTTAPVRQMYGILARESKMSNQDVKAVLTHGFYRSLHPMLPQGAPTSPALANLLSRRLDCRMNGLAQRFKATYTRYADDLTFSGGEEFRRDLRRFVPLVKKILREQRLRPAPGKLRFARKGSPMKVTGIVVNSKLNVPQRDYRELRAILHNCLKLGPASQNRSMHPKFREHLRGRIAFVASINPARGAKLKAAFDRISWPEGFGQSRGPGQATP